jgi:hypothetical protein
MSRSKTSPMTPMRWAAAAAMAASLGACSDLYMDRRDTISLGAGDAIAANKVEQMVDPWPAASGNKNIAFNGQKMQSAVERYRNNKVYRPANITNSALESLQESTPPMPSGGMPGGPAAGATASGAPQ